MRTSGPDFSSVEAESGVGNDSECGQELSLVGWLSEPGPAPSPLGACLLNYQ